MVAHLKNFLVAAFLIINSFAQSEDIQKKESELSSIKKEINNLEKELAAKSAAQKKSFEAVENLTKQNFLLNKVISQLRKDISKTDGEIKNIERKILEIETEIETLQKNYANYVRAIYKKGEYNELESLVDAESVQQAIMRTYYLQVFADKRKEDLTRLQIKKDELAESKLKLDKERNKKLALVEKKNSEKKTLAKKLEQKKSILKSIEKNKTELKKDIAAKKESQIKIENIITDLVFQEELRKKEQLASLDNSMEGNSNIKEENVGYEYDLSTASFASFSELKGKMIWPLNKGKIIRKFGENKHKSLKTITLNYGIDIKAGNDKNVHCVGEGVVAAIDWLPGYGNVIIVSHNNNFRSVYGHVSEIFITEGEKVKSGSVIALVDEGLDGYVLHFEIWNGRDKQNPEKWLGKK